MCERAFTRRGSRTQASVWRPHFGPATCSEKCVVERSGVSPPAPGRCSGGTAPVGIRTLFPRVEPVSVQKTTPAASMPRETPLTPLDCIVARYAAQIKFLSCTSQKTQTSIATGTKGTQCGLTLLRSTSSQTDEEFSVWDVDKAQAGVPAEVPASGDAADLAEAGTQTCSCLLQCDNAGYVAMFAVSVFSRA